MRVVFVSDLETLGGAGIGAARLANALAAKGVSVTWLFNNPDKAPFGESRSWQSRFVGLPRVLQVGVNGLKRVTPQVGYRMGHAYSKRGLVTELAKLSYDVVHVHTLHNGYWDHDTLSEIGPDVPTVWSFHDCWNFSPESQIYVDLEGNTVRLKPDGPDRVATFARKKAYFDARPRAELVANSRFTADYAARTLGRAVDVIHYGLPLDVLSPVDKVTARRALHLPEDAFVVGFIADVRQDKLKGFAVLSGALERLSGGEIHAVAIGEGTAGQETIGATKVHVYGRIASPAILAILYSAADVFVVPSLAESLGMVGMESIACGTPVVGSDVGGIPDVVRPGKTGWLFPKGDSAALHAILDRLRADRSAAAALSAGCCQLAREEWSPDRYARRYLEVYRRAGAPGAAETLGAEVAPCP
ncbi:MAG: glycosyltransferase [Deltaproteobacteria bacterium]|nr:glycosyltransferase [Deltaproteobacteria bacterium]